MSESRQVTARWEKGWGQTVLLLAVNKRNSLKVNVVLKELEENMRTSFESHSKHLFPSTGCGVWQYLHTGQLRNKSKQKGYRSCSERSCKDRSRSEIWNLVEIVKPVALFWSFNLLHQLFIGISHFLFRNEWKSFSPCSQETDGRTERGTDWSSDGLTARQTDCLIDWLIDRSIDRSTDWLTDWLEQREIKTYVVSDHLDKQLPWNEWLQRMVKTPSTDSSCKVKHESCITI